MAAAYAFHIRKHHALADGNKLAALAAMVAFLMMNNWKLDAHNEEVAEVILQLASGDIDKEALTAWVSKNSHAKPSKELREFFQTETGTLLLDAMKATVVVPNGPEFDASLNEAQVAMPVLRDIRTQAANCYLAHDEEGLARNAARMALLMHPFRIAEDMGYEW